MSGSFSVDAKGYCTSVIVFLYFNSKVCKRLKFIYSEKATKLCEIFTLLLTVCTVVKSKVKISKNCVAFSEYMNFTFFPIQSGIKTFLKSRKIFYSHAILASAMISSIKYEISHKIKFQCKFINLLTPWPIRWTTVTYVCKL